MSKRPYSELFTWRYPVTQHVVGHHDGSISVAVTWDGVSFEMSLPNERHRLIASLYQALVSLDPQLVVENHNFRFYDRSRAHAYVDLAGEAVRNHAMARKVRTDVATLLGGHSMTNYPVTVFTLPFIGRKRSAAEFKAQEKAVTKLSEVIKPIVDRMSGARLLSVEEYGALVQRANQPDLTRKSLFTGFDSRFHLNEQWCSAKPLFEDGFLKHGQTYTWVALLDLYPDQTYPGFFESILDASGAEYQLTQLFKATNTRNQITKAEKEEKQEQQGLGQKGGSFLQGKVEDLRAFRTYIASHNIPILNNAFVLKIQHTDRNDLMKQRDTISDWLAGQGARIQHSESIQRFFWRVTQPGQGYLSKYWRPDAADLVLNMAPLNTHSLGAKKPLSMRISEQNSLIYFDLPDGAANHGFISGKTRSGKGVDQVLRILETYPLGLDLYSIEYGGSYRWTVEALGGTYITIDPDKVFIRPMPTYEEIKLAKRNSKYAQLSSFVINSLAYILTGGSSDFMDVDGGNHHLARAATVLDALYDEELQVEGQDAPSLGDFQTTLELVLEHTEDKSSQDYKSYSFLRENLNSFLSSTNGQLFNSDKDGLDLSGDCIGIDIKPVTDTGDTQLISLYLTFILMRLTSKVISNRKRSNLMIDEYHIPAEIAPALVESITNRAVRTWAKENSHIDILSQSPEHFTVAKDVFDQINHRQFMYMENGHEAVRKLFRIPERAARKWEGWLDPGIQKLKFRRAIRQFGSQSFLIRSVVPDWILVLAETHPDKLEIKDRIDHELKGADIWTKIERFNELAKELSAN